MILHFLRDDIVLLSEEMQPDGMCVPIRFSPRHGCLFFKLRELVIVVEARAEPMTDMM